MKEKIRRILPILIFTHEKSSLKNGQNWSAEGDFGIETPICEWKRGPLGPSAEQIFDLRKMIENWSRERSLKNDIGTADPIRDGVC